MYYDLLNVYSRVSIEYTLDISLQNYYSPSFAQSNFKKFVKLSKVFKIVFQRPFVQAKRSNISVTFFLQIFR